MVRRVPIIHEFCNDKIIVREWNNYEKRYWEKERLPSVEEYINQLALSEKQIKKSKIDESFLFYGLDYYREHPEIDPFTNKIKKDLHSSPKLSEDPLE